MAQYGASRLLRIYPPLLFSLALVIFLYQISPFVFASGTHTYLPAGDNGYLARKVFTYQKVEVVASALFLNGFFFNPINANGPLWSLSVEVWYYIMAAIVAIPRGWWKLLSIPALIALAYIGQNNLDFLRYMLVWWLGFATSALHSRGRLPRHEFFLSILVIAGTVTTVLGAYYVMASVKSGTFTPYLYLIPYFNVASGISACAAIGLVLHGRSVFPSRFAPCARFSYTLYLIHVPIVLFAYGILQKYIQDRMLLAAGTAFLVGAGCVFLARFLSTFLEQPALTKRLVLSILRRKRYL